MLLLTPNSILQMNATIIAGLLILLTFQLTTFESQEDLVQQTRKLDFEEESLNKMLTEADDDLKIGIKEKLNEIKIERESVRAKLTAVSIIPYVIYIRTNPAVLTGGIILPFIISSAIILRCGIYQKKTDEYNPKWPLRISFMGLVILSTYFLYQVFPLGKFATDQFIFP